MLDPLPSGRVRLAVPCRYHNCPNAAAMVELLPGPGAGRTVVVSGYRDGGELAERVAEADLAGVRDLAEKLYDLGLAPFFCPVCERSYCEDHWRGDRCPYGH